MRKPKSVVGLIKLKRDRAKVYVLVAALATFLAGYVVGSFVGQPGTTAWSGTFVGVVWPHLYIEVSPMGYPAVGCPWIVNVYVVDVVSNNVILRPSNNSTVVVTVKHGNYGQAYNLPVGADGQATFDFLPGCSDVAFQAISGELSSEKIVVSTHYVSSDVVDSLISVNGLMSAVSTAGGALTIHSKKTRNMLKITSVVVISLFAAVSFFSLYSKLFQGTIWGYPENLFDSVITLTLLKYLTFFGFVLISVLAVLAIVFRPRASK